MKTQSSKRNLETFIETQDDRSRLLKAVKRARAGDKPDIMIELEPRMARWIERLGQAMARKFGLTQTRGEWVAFSVIAGQALRRAMKGAHA